MQAPMGTYAVYLSLRREGAYLYSDDMHHAAYHLIGYWIFASTIDVQNTSDHKADLG